jgi:uncharacterized membrane protein YphA (DoxX/SURF4 family)
MSAYHTFNTYYRTVKNNRWHSYFAVFCRFILAYAFIVAGFVKVFGERFASGLSEIHPMGAYLTALHHTGVYYTFIGMAQILAAILLLIPSTVVLGALLYFPIILNICVLSLALRFEGSFVTAPLMVLANLYLLVWHYDKLQYLFPWHKSPNKNLEKQAVTRSNRFPFVFFIAVTTIVALTIIIFLKGFDIMPRNSLKDCKTQYVNSSNKNVANAFCECIHIKGNPLKDCLADFEKQKQ